jgi:pilus assembly protein FimV
VRNTLKNPISKPSLGTLSQAAPRASRISIWRTPVAAAALALSLALPALDAQALALGKVNVLSALGEPLRAEIEVPDINVEEAASLKASIASGDAFRAAGLEYNSALNGAQITLQRRPNGSSYLKLTSDRPVNEPFVDLILEATWATGRVVRDYTMLFDPSNARVQPAPSSNTAAGVAPSAAAGTSAMTSPAARSSASPATSGARAPVAPRPVAVRPAPSPAPAPVSQSAKAGNTATQIAVRYKPAGVSLDQMLVSMLSANPDAFIDGNINRLKKGAVLDIPTAETASATSEDQARQTITAQSKDFNEFRRRLAQGAPTATAPSASRKATGTVQAEVQDRKATAATPDKLTLSKGAVAAAGVASGTKAAKDSGKEDAIAKEKAAKDAAARTAELSKNIQELSKLNAPTPTVAIAKPSAPVAPAPATPASAAAVPAITVPAAVAPVTVAATPTTPAVATPTAVIAPTATAASATPPVTDTLAATPVVDTPKPKPVVVAPPPPPEPSLVDSVLGSPYTPLSAGGLAAVLIGFGAYRFRQRKKGAQVDSSFLESRLQPDSFFGASGGQRVDTNDAPNSASGSSMVYSPSQLDAAGDVDPVAEADVYLAYGRDLQAEEILKEAMRTNPARVAIHVKLMEIYAKRRDTKAFESVANEAFVVTKGHGAEWETVSALGRDIDPANPLYQHGGGANGAVSGLGALGAMGAVAAAGMSAAGMSTSAFAGNTTPQAVQSQNAADPDVDFDLDLDFSSGDDLMDAPQFADPSHVTTSPIHVQQTSGMARQPSADPGVDLSFDAPMAMSAPDMDSFANGLDFDPAPPSLSAAIPTAPMAIAAGAAEPAFEALEFDLGDLSLDLPGAATPAMANFASDEGLSGDPLETKLALAQEFREIGDNDGARSLAQEVAQEASGALKARAQRMVADLS